MTEPKLRPESALRLLAVHVTNVAVANQQMLNDRQRKLIHHSARILRDVANMLAPPTWNPRQRWDKLEERQRSAVSGQRSAVGGQQTWTPACAGVTRREKAEITTAEPAKAGIEATRRVIPAKAGIQAQR